MALVQVAPSAAVSRSRVQELVAHAGLGQWLCLTDNTRNACRLKLYLMPRDSPFATSVRPPPPAPPPTSSSPAHRSVQNGVLLLLPRTVSRMLGPTAAAACTMWFRHACRSCMPAIPLATHGGIATRACRAPVDPEQMRCTVRCGQA